MMNNKDKAKKEIKRLCKTSNELINTIQVYANFMDDFFKEEEKRNFYAEIYVEYKEYSNSIISILKDNGFIK